jgi:hypothetical protein
VAPINWISECGKYALYPEPELKTYMTSQTSKKLPNIKNLKFQHKFFQAYAEPNLVDFKEYRVHEYHAHGFVSEYDVDTKSSNYNFCGY